MAANVVGIGLVIDFWCRSRQPVISQRLNIPHHLTRLCSSSTKAAVTANFTRELSLLETSLLRMVDHVGMGHCLGRQATINGTARWIGQGFAENSEQTRHQHSRQMT